jgi:hypothetical protein
MDAPLDQRGPNPNTSYLIRNNKTTISYLCQKIQPNAMPTRAAFGAGDRANGHAA